MSDQDVFNQDQAAADKAAAANPADAFSDQLASITNADGSPKYTDVAQALDSIPHAQGHIQVIETENATLKAELAKAEAAKELLEKAGGANQQPEGLTAEEVATITQQTIADQSEANRKADNVASVNSKFAEIYGEKASEQMKILASESGMSVSAIKDLAEKSPLAVYRMAGITTQSAAPAPKTPDAGQRGDNFQPSERQAEEPKPVMSGATSSQMVDNWRAAGEKIKQQG